MTVRRKREGVVEKDMTEEQLIEKPFAQAKEYHIKQEAKTDRIEKCALYKQGRGSIVGQHPRRVDPVLKRVPRRYEEWNTGTTSKQILQRLRYWITSYEKRNGAVSSTTDADVCGDFNLPRLTSGDRCEFNFKILI